MIDAYNSTLGHIFGNFNSNQELNSYMEGWYYLTQILAMFIIAAGVPIAINSLRIARKNLRHLEYINDENNKIQERLILQSRLKELSHEWNSRAFIEARNRAAYMFEVEFEGRLIEVREKLFTKDRLGDWIFISMIAHFFLRLSYIQESKQIDFDNAALEFREAIDYWLKYLLAAYGDQASEERLRSQLIKIHKRYDDSKPEKTMNQDIEAKSDCISLHG